MASLVWTLFHFHQKILSLIGLQKFVTVQRGEEISETGRNSFDAIRKKPNQRSHQEGYNRTTPYYASTLTCQATVLKQLLLSPLPFAKKVFLGHISTELLHSNGFLSFSWTEPEKSC